jgi:hypothetical protein
MCQANPSTITEKNGCTILTWKIVNVREVYLDGEGVPGEAQRSVCPKKTTTYTWTIIKPDGSQTECIALVQVSVSK